MAKETIRRASINVWTAIWLSLILLIVLSVILDLTGALNAVRESQRSGSSAVVEDQAATADASIVSQQGRFQVKVRRPVGPPTVELQPTDPSGRAARVACSTCHSIRPANLQNRSPSDLKQFHQDMSFTHGQLACYACHNPNDSDTLRLADGRVVEYVNVMNLCSQCHGNQVQDYTRGVHGGMTGYWDLSRGERVRNNCIDCHDPHVPQFPMMQPTFKPRDRFLTPTVHGEQPHHGKTDDGAAGRE